MTLHFIHIGKTGGTAIKRALLSAKVASWADATVAVPFRSPYGPIQLHGHHFRLRDVPPGDHAFFVIRDPVDRFVSAFYSRLSEGRPRYFFEWSPEERRAFSAFSTPQQLAEALASEHPEERSLAVSAMRSIRHMRPMRRFLGTPEQLRSSLSQVVYIARQETLVTDWEQLRVLLQLPPEAQLPTSSKSAHRRDRSLDDPLDVDAMAALRRWYRRDYELLALCDGVRAWKGWGAGRPPRGIARVGFEIRRLHGVPAVGGLSPRTREPRRTR